MPQKIISGNVNTDFGDSGVGSVTTKTLQFTPSTSPALAGASIAVQARVTGSSAAFVPILYKRRNLAGVVSDDTSVSTAITGAALIEVNIAGLELRLATSGLSAGTMTVDYQDMQG
jgi:hypothetical protein